ncbi:2-oxo-4-hydroxy-4-carboxy-5-ureidoimidazoline decarboxylase [Thiosulfativibrio zosterae]|uniref:2-oxo-4-hydroxy-4-carboxy-5-ureidoimidazoline decarboxylase n=1 Tax=Thiosulfativibrio zosterae TaxID=2675053 RepID=A0A6F8PPB4_9GAMM|nr:2-oxo-4-hydroxy-4-carboxy-5-ureidoimidazoline decarboxylase [Thiosulfativibrio zosterae]BBP43878.1 2-oxo-4-hydroxy-4-carboxy-5-ureidoimidazoline decarboxylase [Thiosulfativibrio zosterae]
MTLTELNQLSLQAFVTVCEPLLEHCDWVLPQLAATRPFMSVEDMQHKLGLALKSAPLALQKQALCLHPKLGVGKAQPGFSQSEQAQAGLSQLSDEELLQFQTLNQAYETKMGFPFVVAVTGLNKSQILELMAVRVQSTEAAEWPIALNELIKIAQIRVKKLITD